MMSPEQAQLWADIMVEYGREFGPDALHQLMLDADVRLLADLLFHFVNNRAHPS